MINFAENQPNDLPEQEFSEEAHDGNDSAPGQELEQIRSSPDPATVDLTASDYLDFLDFETHKAHRVAEECIAGKYAVLDDLPPRAMLPLSPQMPPFFRIFIERRVRAEIKKLIAARKIAEAHTSVTGALARSAKNQPQGY